MLTSALSCQEYICTHSAKEIAEHLRHDQKLCNSGGLPSILALHLPPDISSPLAGEIAACLWERSLNRRGGVGTGGESGLGDNVRLLPMQRLRYQGLLDSIKSYLSRFQPRKEPGTSDSDIPVSVVQSNIPTTQEFETAIKVLEYLMRVPATNVTLKTPVEEAITAVETHIALDPERRIAYQSIPGSLARSLHKSKGNKARKAGRFGRCYMCCYEIITPHHYYPSLCTPCGSFNLQESSITHPEKLDMRDKTALVTGGRVNLGYSVALRLLRCGASVIVSSRYPLDAEARYRAEPDFEKWQNRIFVVGADFRHMKDAGGLLVQVKKILNMWNKDGKKEALLDVLVNNAAQTLTDSTTKEKTAVEQEQKLLDAGIYGRLQFGDYKAKIRGGTRENRMLTGPEVGDENSYYGEGDSNKLCGLSNNATNLSDPEYQLPEKTCNPPGLSEVTVVQKSSWTQTISQIPYQDIGDVLAINSFVPLMLIRELLPLMGTTRRNTNPTVVEEAEELHGKQQTPRTRKPAGYIINVSSREGLSEINPTASAKNGCHVHTNMSKAALNMITETEGFTVWHDRRVAMNSIDPGFMNAADGRACPIGWEDGAARVLWCVAKGEVENESIWGRFLKHFGRAEAVVRGL